MFRKEGQRDCGNSGLTGGPYSSFKREGSRQLNSPSAIKRENSEAAWYMLSHFIILF